MDHNTGKTDHCAALRCCWWCMVSQACIRLVYDGSQTTTWGLKHIPILESICVFFQARRCGCSLWSISSVLPAFSAAAKRVTAPVSPHCLFWRHHETQLVKVHSLTFYYSVSQSIRRVNVVTGYCSGCCFEIPIRPFLQKVRLHWLFLGHTASFVCALGGRERAVNSELTGERDRTMLTLFVKWGEGLNMRIRAHARAAVLEWATCCGAACWSSASTQKSQLNKSWVSSDSSWPTFLQQHPVEAGHSLEALCFKFHFSWDVVQRGVCTQVLTFL